MEVKNKFPSNLEDIEKLAYELIMQKGHPERADGWTHTKGGVETGATWRRAKEIYGSIGLKMRAINNVEYDLIDLNATFAKKKIDLPLSIAPLWAAINFVSDDPFSEIAKAAAQLNIAAGIGYPSDIKVFSNMAGLGAKTFRIIKPVKDRNNLIQELKDSFNNGCYAAGIDIDSIAGLKPAGDEIRFSNIARPYDADELKNIREIVPNGKFIIKGVMSAEDALDAVRIGADTIIVSTHVGYCLDYSLSPLEVLPRIKKAVGNQIEIVVDSGITRGTDIIKTIALGADSVLIGRLVVWGLLIDGMEGVIHIIRRLEAEIRRSMVLMGIKSLKDLTVGHLVPLDEKGERILKEAQ